MSHATLYLPSKGLRVRVRGAWRRYRCGRRFGHFPASDEPMCLRCNARLN